MTSLALAPSRSAIGALSPVTLDEVLALASLQTRVDRKYVMVPATFERLVDRLADDLHVLEIDGRRSFAYESTYFDDASLSSYLAAAHGRRYRYKVRTRTYVDSGECMLEVKRRSGRGETVKERVPYPTVDSGLLTAAGRAFVATVVPSLAVDELRPVLRSTFERVTLVDLRAGARMTCDAGLVCSVPGGGAVHLDGYVLLETKSPGPATPADRMLWSEGVRPATISKFCVGLAALDPALPANKWNRTLRRYFAWTPDRRQARPDDRGKESALHERISCLSRRSLDRRSGRTHDARRRHRPSPGHQSTMRSAGSSEGGRLTSAPAALRSTRYHWLSGPE